jgi:hypothetical protein
LHEHLSGVEVRAELERDVSVMLPSLVDCDDM